MDKTMVVFAWIVIAGSFFAAGWHAHQLYIFFEYGISTKDGVVYTDYEED